MLNKLSDGDKRFLLLASVIGVCLIVVLCIIELLLSYYKLSSSFLLSLIGTLVTIIALLFSIHQQMQIRDTAAAIQENTKNIYKNIKREYHVWNYDMAISLTTEIENCLTNDQTPAALILVRQLQARLSACKKVYHLDILNELDACCNRDLPGDKSFKQIIDECKSACETNELEKIGNLGQRISNEYVLLLNRNYARKTSHIRDAVVRLRDILTQAKPSPISQFSHSNN